jgi:hypothetical protein
MGFSESNQALVEHQKANDNNCLNSCLPLIGKVPGFSLALAEKP